MLNVVVIMGRLTAQPELRTTGNGISVSSFSVAVDRSYQSGGERQTDFINCVFSVCNIRYKFCCRF